MRMLTPVVLAVTLAASGAASRPAAAQDVLIDRVLATVEGRVITLSDVRAARVVGLGGTGRGGGSTDAVLSALIDRALVLEEVERYAPPEPEAADVDRAVAALRAARGPAFDDAARAVGLDDAAVRLWARNDLRIERYLAQRFAATIELTDEDIESYRRAHAGDPGPARDDAAIRAAVTAERRTALVREWIDGLRARAGVSISAPVP